MSAPPLSVVMAVHNAMPFVEDSVRSLLAQSFGDFEFVVGDDGSTDGTTEVLRALASADRRIRLLRRESKSGLATSANWVVGNARAQFVAVAHGDDVSAPERLGRQIELLRAHPEAVLVGVLSDGIDESGRIVRPADLKRLIEPGPFAPIAHSSIMFRKNRFEEIGGYRLEADYWEDLDLYLRLAEHGRILVIPEVLNYVRHASTSTRLRDEQVRVEDRVATMYRCVAAYVAGEDYTWMLRGRQSDDPAAQAGRLPPRTFVACGWTDVWNSRSPAMVRRMLRRASLGLNRASLETLVWVLWSSLSPRSLRLVSRTLIAIGNARARRAIGSRPTLPWDPTAARRRPPAAAETPDATTAGDR